MNFNPPSADDVLPSPWRSWFAAVGRRMNDISGQGTTANRPTRGLYVGRPYFDTTLGKPVWYDGTNWIDATGATV